MTDPNLPFVRRAHADKPGIVGAQWWHESVATQVSRRRALTTLATAGAVLATAASVGTCVLGVARSGSSSSGASGAPDVRYEPRSALEMQKKYGWDFGAAGEDLVFDGRSVAPFDRSALSNLLRDMAPVESRDQPFYVSTLFQSPTARPPERRNLEVQEQFTPLEDVLVPISTAGMDVAFAQGKAYAELVAANKKAHPLAELAVVVDLEGPEAVAFAAGAAGIFDPVFLFDNWPHPRGVVPAHRTLAAAAYYQPLFARMQAARPRVAPPLFVLDRARLATYTDEASQFDNRHVARLPPTSWLTGNGIKDLVYVAPSSMTRAAIESHDLVDVFLAYAAAGVVLHAMPPGAFLPVPEHLLAAPPKPGSAGAHADAGSDGGATPATPHEDVYAYAGDPKAGPRFFADWGLPANRVGYNDVMRYLPATRTTSYSTGMPAVDGRPPQPPSFGVVPVAIAVATGAIIGARAARSGSWNRTTSSGTGS